MPLGIVSLKMIRFLYGHTSNAIVALRLVDRLYERNAEISLVLRDVSTRLSSANWSLRNNLHVRRLYMYVYRFTKTYPEDEDRTVIHTR